MTGPTVATDDAAELRRMVYRVLSSLFLFPDEERLTTLATAVPELRRRSAPLRGLTFYRAWSPLLRVLGGLTERETERVQEEYTQLFVAGTRDRSCPPHESAYDDGVGQDVGFAVARVETAYRAAGLAVGGPTAGELPDHVAVELDFLGELCREEGLATSHDAATEWRERQRAFLIDHLLRWLPRFARAVASAAPDGFYRRVADTAVEFAEHEALLLEALLWGAPTPSDAR